MSYFSGITIAQKDGDIQTSSRHIVFTFDTSSGWDEYPDRSAIEMASLNFQGDLVGASERARELLLVVPLSTTIFILIIGFNSDVLPLVRPPSTNVSSHIADFWILGESSTAEVPASTNRRNGTFFTF